MRNLEERVKVDKLKEALYTIFSEYGNVIDIVAKTNLKAKGQAFIVFDKPEPALTAVEELQGFELFEKPMQVALARTRSDATVQRYCSEEEFEAHKRHRMAEKGMLEKSRSCPCTWLLTTAQLQKGRKLPKPKNRSASRDQFLGAVSRLARARPRVRAVLGSNPRPLVQLRWSQTSICRRTAFYSFRTSRTTSTKMPSQPSLGASRAFAKCVWCLAAVVLPLLSTSPRQAPLLLRKIRQACRSRMARR